MSEDYISYLAVTLIECARESGGGILKGPSSKIGAMAEKYFGTFSESELQDALGLLQKAGVATRYQDRFAGDFVEIRFVRLGWFAKSVEAELEAEHKFFLENPSYPDPAQMLKSLALGSKPPSTKHIDVSKSNQAILAYHKFGSDWLLGALPSIRLERESGSIVLGPLIPASDRIVSLIHNQQTELENSTTELIETLEAENSIDGDSSLRQRVLGQLKAGRELIRAQSFSAYLLHQTLMTALGGLIEKYKGQAIGETAKKLLGLLIEHIFKAS